MPKNSDFSCVFVCAPIGNNTNFQLTSEFMKPGALPMFALTEFGNYLASMVDFHGTESTPVEVLIVANEPYPKVKVSCDKLTYSIKRTGYSRVVNQKVASHIFSLIFTAWYCNSVDHSPEAKQHTWNVAQSFGNNRTSKIPLNPQERKEVVTFLKVFLTEIGLFIPMNLSGKDGDTL